MDKLNERNEAAELEKKNDDEKGVLKNENVYRQSTSEVSTGQVDGTIHRFADKRIPKLHFTKFHLRLKAVQPNPHLHYHIANREDIEQFGEPMCPSRNSPVLPKRTNILSTADDVVNYFTNEIQDEVVAYYDHQEGDSHF